MLYGNILYDQPNNKSSCQKIETIQYNADLAITNAIKGTSQIKLYFEFRSWFRKLCLFFMIKKKWFTRISIQYYTTKQHQYHNWSIAEVTTF